MAALVRQVFLEEADELLMIARHDDEAEDDRDRLHRMRGRR